MQSLYRCKQNKNNSKTKKKFEKKNWFCFKIKNSSLKCSMWNNHKFSASYAFSLFKQTKYTNIVVELSNINNNNGFD